MSVTWFSDANPHEICIIKIGGQPQIKKIEGSSNENEYRAIIWAMEQMEQGDTLLSDSKLAVCQITNGWKVSAINLKPLNFQAKRLIREKNITLAWTPREENLAGHMI